MFCPDCHRNLLPISLTSGDDRVVLDYCASCGGVWSDRGEVNYIKLKELMPLAQALPNNPKEPNEPTHLCPRDRIKMEIFKGESVPTYLDLYRCDKCSGVWFPYSTLFQFKQAQTAKLKYFKSWQLPLHSIYAILLPVLILFIIGGGLIATLSGVTRNTDVRLRAQDPISRPLIINVKADEVYIGFTTITPAQTKIRYWIEGQPVTETWVSSNPQERHTVRLTGLTPQAIYYFELVIVGPSEVVSPIHSFTAQVQ